MIIPSPKLGNSIQMTIADAVAAIQGFPESIGIVTDFGVADITKKEAVRMVETCEERTVVVSYSPGQLILEYPENAY